MSRVVLNLTIRNVDAEVEVTLTGDYDQPTVEAVTLCDGCIELDIQTIALLLGAEEWDQFISEAIDKRNAQPVEVISGPTGYPSPLDAAYHNRR